MSLIRDLVFLVEESQSHLISSDIVIEGRTSAEIVYHAKLLQEAGLVLASDLSTRGNRDAIALQRLTWDGHEFADSAREPSRWEKVWGFTKSAGGIALPVLLQVLKDFAVNEAKTRLGLQK